MKVRRTVRVPGAGVFLTTTVPEIPPILPHQLEHNQVLHTQVVLLTVFTEDVPRVGAQDRLTIENLGQGFHRVFVHYGFMQTPNIPVALRLAEGMGLELDLDHVTYFLGRESIIPTDEVPAMQLWRARLFAFIARNAMGATTFYKLPPDRVVELGIQVLV